MSRRTSGGVGMPTTTTLQPQFEFVTTWAQSMLTACNTHNAEAIALLCTEDVIWEDPGWPQPLRGREAVQGFLESMFRAFPDLLIEADSLYTSPSESRILAPYRMSGTMLGKWEPFDLAPTNAHFSIAGVDQWTFRGEQLCHYATYCNDMDLVRQLGLLPASGSAAERAIVQLQRLRARFHRRAARRP